MARTSTDPKADIITFRIPSALKQAFAEIAEEEAKPIGALLRELVRERVEQNVLAVFARALRNVFEFERGREFGQRVSHISCHCNLLYCLQTMIRLVALKENLLNLEPRRTQRTRRKA